MADTTVDRWDELAARLAAIEGRLGALERVMTEWGLVRRRFAPPVPVPPAPKVVAATGEVVAGAEGRTSESAPAVVGRGWQPTRGRAV